MVFDQLCSVTTPELFPPHPPAEAMDNADAMPGGGVFYIYGCFNRPLHVQMPERCDAAGNAGEAAGNEAGASACRLR
jgi:hypothetical protein